MKFLIFFALTITIPLGNNGYEVKVVDNKEPIAKAEDMKYEKLSALKSKSVTKYRACVEGTVLSDDRCEECGVTFNNPNVRIVGGSIAQSNSWPAQAFVKFTYSGSYKFDDEPETSVSVSFESICGATLINRYTILTAANCIPSKFDYNYKNSTVEISITFNEIYPNWESMIKVYLGLQKVTNLGNAFVVEKLIKNEGYNSETEINDIALLLLKERVELSSKIQMACLPPALSFTYPPGYTTCYGVGWGSTVQGEASNKTSDELKNVKLTIYNSEICSNIFPEVPKNWSSQICAGDVSGESDFCYGDTGSGLYIKDTLNYKNKYVLVGIQSYGQIECAVKDYANVLTRTSFYLDWIRANMKYEKSNGLCIHKISTSIFLVILIALCHFYF